MEEKEPEELEGTYIKLEKLEEDSHKVLEFINEELEVKEFDNYMVLLDNMKEILKAGIQSQQNQPQEIEASELGDPDYIG